MKTETQPKTLHRRYRDRTSTTKGIHLLGAVPLLLALLLPPLARCQAAATNLVYYSLGEDDPGARAGSLADSSTADRLGVLNLSRIGSPHYSSGVSSLAAAQLQTSLCMEFDGLSQFLSNRVVSTAVDNFALEAWVKPNTAAPGDYCIVHNGSTGINGWGLFQQGNSFRALFGGVTYFGAGTVVPGVWTHLAVVRNNGVPSFYVNGVANSRVPSAPNPPVGGFAIGCHPQAPAFEFFAGAVDEVRVLTFAAGEFSTGLLLFGQERIATLPASPITPKSATLHGFANPSGLSTLGWFEWGPTTGYGQASSPLPLGDGVDRAFFEQSVPGVPYGQRFHFRAVASNLFGIFPGFDQTAATPGFAGAQVEVPLSSVRTAAWGDYDGDGLLDLLVSGRAAGANHTQLWHNTGNGFVDVTGSVVPGLPTLTGTAMAWGDYDNDGRLDFAILGSGVDDRGVTQVWHNTGHGFENVSIERLAGFEGGAVAWIDFNRDGRLDLIFTGYTDDGSPTSQIWQNSVEGFFEVTGLAAPDLAQVGNSSIAVGDFNNDGWPDFLILGYNGESAITQLWRNTGGAFSNVTQTMTPGIPPLSQGTAVWGDYDNDGRLDFVIGGAEADGTFVSQIWRNTPGGFTNSTSSLAPNLRGLVAGSAAWADYDGDGSLDLVLTGSDSTGADTFQLLHNTLPGGDATPLEPTALNQHLLHGVPVLTWSAGRDDETPSSGLSYNVRIGTTPGGRDVLSADSSNDGGRLLPTRGAVQGQTAYTFAQARIGEVYYWSVQTVDSANLRHPWTPAPLAWNATHDPHLEPA